MISIFVLKQADSEKGPSNRQADCSRGRVQKWRSFVAQLFLFLFSAQEDRPEPSSEDGRRPVQLIAVQASPWSDAMETLVNESPSLKSILEWMRSQWRRSSMSAEIGSNLRFRRTSRAATRISLQLIHQTIYDSSQQAVTVIKPTNACTKAVYMH